MVDPCTCLTKSNTNPKCCLILVTILRTSLADKCHCSSTTIATTLQMKRMNLASITVTTTLQKTWMNIEHGVHHSIHHISKEKDELGVHQSHQATPKDKDDPDVWRGTISQSRSASGIAISGSCSRRRKQRSYKEKQRPIIQTYASSDHTSFIQTQELRSDEHTQGTSRTLGFTQVL